MSTDIIVAHFNNTIVRYSGFTSTVVTQFNGPSVNMHGAHFDGTDLWTCAHQGGGSTRAIWQHDGISASILQTIPFTPTATGPSGLTSDGTNLISCTADGVEMKVYRHSGFTGTIDETLTLSHQPFGVAWTGTDLVTTDRLNIYVHDGFSTTIDQTLTAPGGGQGIYDVAFDGTNLICCHYDATIYKMDGISASIDTQFNSSVGSPQGICSLNWTGLVPNIYTVTMQYKQAGGVYADVTASLGEIGADIGLGTHVAYWDGPRQDRVDIEISDAQVQLTLVPDGGNQGTNSANVTSAAQLSAGDGTGAQGDIKVEYEIT